MFTCNFCTDNLQHLQYKSQSNKSHLHSVEKINVESVMVLTYTAVLHLCRAYPGLHERTKKEVYTKTQWSKMDHAGKHKRESYS
ncbi:hypothetical protein GDO78_001314 [Eleutherodactylus coqui]|uniref:Uncharacterized protein n=1 Tax=Eleutherodactylus coqui TaxID=57060 RepID=A0A8J6KHM8_ELECQ|nr:hypothetical protein GDO78_001314 [Eleutherodactylus coqui]